MRNWLARFLGRPTETEFAEEVRSHLAHEIDDQVDRGLAPDEARYAAIRRFGNVTRHLERFREASPVFWLETLWQDVRTGWRSLCRTPVLSTVAILSLGLGIGANTSVYTVSRAVLLDPLRVPEADRMFVIRAENNLVSLMPGVTPAELDDIVQLAGTFGSAGLYNERAMTVRVSGGLTREFFLFASKEATEAFGVQPRLGRWPTDEEYRSGARVAVLTDRLWRQYGADAGILGSRMRLPPRPNSGLLEADFTIIGVAPPSLQGRFVGMPYGALLPFRSQEALDPGSISKAVILNGGMLGRLAPGQSMATATQKVAAWRLPPRGPKATPRRLQLLPAADVALAGDRRVSLMRALGGLAGLAGVVLLLGCSNLASAMLARSGARRHELAMRVSLGASRSRLVRLLVIEYLLLAVLSTAAALALSQAMVQSFPASLAIGRRWLVVPIEVPLEVTLHVTAFAAALGLASCITFGLVPALRLTGVDPMTALRGGGQLRHTGRSRPRRLLLAGQVAASSLLLVGAVLLGHAVADGTSIDPGYSGDGHLLYARVQFGQPAEAIPMLRRRILEKLGAEPSFVAAAFTSSTQPFGPGRVGDRIMVDGTERVPVSRELARNMSGGRVLAEFVESSYRETLGLPLLYGRDLQPTDGNSSEPGVLVNEALARQFWPGGGGIGSQIRVHALNQEWLPVTNSARIVGVVGNARYDIKSGTAPCVYFLNDGVLTNGLYLRMRDDARRATATVRQVLQAVQPDEPPPLVLSRDDYVRAELAAERMLLQILAWFAGLALVLSLIGVYGLASDTVAQRTREIAIRLALGGPEGAVVRLVTRSALVATVAGLAVGLAGAAVAASAAHAFVFGLEPFRPSAYSSAAVLILGVAALGLWWPASRAVKIAPAQTLRAE